MKSGNLNFVETSGLLRACNGTALPLWNLWWTRWCWVWFSSEYFFVSLSVM